MNPSSITHPPSYPRYVELHARSAFSFLRGASHPEQLVERAAALEMGTLAICDRDGVYGSARAHAKAGELGMSARVGAELTLEDGCVIPVLVKNRRGYQNLCRLITEAKLRGTKAESSIRWAELPEFSDGLIALTGDTEGLARDLPTAEPALRRLLDAFGPGHVFVEIQRHFQRDEIARNQALVDLAGAHRVPLVATNGVCYATPARRRALDVFTCIRHHTHLDAAGRLLSPNAECHLKSPQEMSRLFADLPEAITNTAHIAERLEFTLQDLGYEFPRYPLPPHHDADSFLRDRVIEGAKKRYPHGSPAAYAQIDKELRVIAKLGFSGYFLIVWDIVRYCQQSDILVQGRGSAANSVVCYCLEITACDPIAYNLLFERFLSEGRSSWPDIDLDLPSGERREQVIQEVYRRYGRHGAAMTANVITYRGRSAMREVGKALNLSTDILDRFSSLYASGDFPHTLQLADQLRQAGLPTDHPRTAAAIELYEQIRSLPRHLGQHSGGMIICQHALSSVVPLENASMPGRVVAQWDKDDCEDLGIIKVDFLGLGMMSAIQECLTLCSQRHGDSRDMADIPKEDPAVYDMLQRADTIGTFQVESRAQMASLPRMMPTQFYDIVMQVAIIRPGPIQGGMLQPLYDRRAGLEDPTPLHPDLEETLGKTYGVPLFQEQLLKMAMIMADFSGNEAEELRRALSFHRSHERMDKICVKLRAAMTRKHIEPALAERIVQFIQSFAVYGFPESHAISFALIAYASCWLKAHRAPEFYAALLNNQPMGFYSSATLIRDAKQRDVRIRPVSVLESDYDCTVGGDGSIRLGLRIVRGMAARFGRAIVEQRRLRAFDSLPDLRARTRIDKAALRVLARIGALNGLVEHRREGQWQAEFPLHTDDLPGLADAHPVPPPLAPMNAFERLQADFDGTGVTTGTHPMALIREQIPEIIRAADLEQAPDGARVRAGGLVICRQRPGTAKGVVFISLEDETGVANAIVTSAMFEKCRLIITQEVFLQITGRVQRRHGTIHLQAERIERLEYAELTTPTSHDFH